MVVAVIGAVVALIGAGVLAYVFFFHEKTIVPTKAAGALSDAVSEQTGFTPTDASCPSGVEAKVGATFDCHFTGPDGSPFTAHMTVKKVDGDYVEFNIRWTPS